MAVMGARAGGRRLLRLGLTAAGASIGAIALSLLLGGASASAVDDDSSGLLREAGSAVGSAVAVVAEPADALVPGLASAAAPAAPAVQAVLAPAAPVAQAALDAAPAIAESAPVAVAEPVLVEAVQPLLEPLAPVTEPAAGLRQRAAEVVAPALEPIAEAVEGAIDSAPVADELLAGEPVLSPPPVSEALLDETPPAAAVPGTETEALDASVAPSQETGAAVMPLPRLIAMAPLLIALVAAPPPGPDAGPGPGAPGSVPSGATGGASGGQPPGVTHAHFAPQLTGGSVGAVEQDRVPASLVEELASSPD